MDSATTNLRGTPLLSLLVHAAGGTAEPTADEAPTYEPTPDIASPTPPPQPTPTPIQLQFIDIGMGPDTTWGDLIIQFSSSEQKCLNTELADSRDEVYGTYILTDPDFPDWGLTYFECLNEDTAGAVFGSLILTGILEDDTVSLTDAEVQCVGEWADELDIQAILPGLADENEAALAMLLEGLTQCLSSVYMPEFLEAMNIDADALTTEERDCVVEWMAGFDWVAVMESTYGGDMTWLQENLPQLMQCSPRAFLPIFFADFGIDLDNLTSEERACLEEWIVDLDWGPLLGVMDEDPYASFDEALSESLELIACVPDLFMEDSEDHDPDS